MHTYTQIDKHKTLLESQKFAENLDFHYDRDAETVQHNEAAKYLFPQYFLFPVLLFLYCLYISYLEIILTAIFKSFNRFKLFTNSTVCLPSYGKKILTHLLGPLVKKTCIKLYKNTPKRYLFTLVFIFHKVFMCIRECFGVWSFVLCGFFCPQFW